MFVFSGRLPALIQILNKKLIYHIGKMFQKNELSQEKKSIIVSSIVLMYAYIISTLVLGIIQLTQIVVLIKYAKTGMTNMASLQLKSAWKGRFLVNV